MGPDQVTVGEEMTISSTWRLLRLDFLATDEEEKNVVKAYREMTFFLARKGDRRGRFSTRGDKCHMVPAIRGRHFSSLEQSTPSEEPIVSPLAMRRAMRARATCFRCLSIMIGEAKGRGSCLADYFLTSSISCTDPVAKVCSQNRPPLLLPRT